MEHLILACSMVIHHIFPHSLIRLLKQYTLSPFQEHLAKEKQSEPHKAITGSHNTHITCLLPTPSLQPNFVLNLFCSFFPISALSTFCSRCISHTLFLLLILHSVYTFLCQAVSIGLLSLDWCGVNNSHHCQ